MSVSTTDRVAVFTHGINWASMVQEKLPMDAVSANATSERFNARPFEWLTIAARTSLVDQTAAKPAWGGTARVRLMRDVWGDGSLLLPVGGSSETVKVTASAAANLAISSFVEFDADGVIERIPGRGLGDVVAQVTTAHATTNTAFDLVILGWCGALPPVPVDLLPQVLLPRS